MSDTAKMMMYDAKKKSVGVAYLLWLVLGPFGAHRFYIGHIGSGLMYMFLQMATIMTVDEGTWMYPMTIVIVWWVIDAFLIPNIIRKENLLLASEITEGAMLIK